MKHHNEAKFAELLSVLDSSDVIRAEDEKLVIFTEHRDTLDSLARRLEERGYVVATIHGGMDVDARRQAQTHFATRAKIMVATDAAGEGIDLQFCRYLINWDIPWNPNRLEQRMGRIHRYGQRDDVWIYNLAARNTREGSVLEKVLTKLDVMREQMESDRVYDVIAEWLEGVPMVELIERAIDSEDDEAGSRETEAVLPAASRERAEGLIALQKKTSLATQGRVTPEGVHLRTLWGELAFQLGGSRLYERVRANDETRRVPQGIFVEVLRESAPCLTLLD